MAGYLQAAGYGFQIAGMIYTAVELKASARKALRQAQRNAERILTDAADEVRLRRIQGQRLEGTQRNRLAAVNVRVGTGSPLDVLAETAFTTEFAVRKINELAARLVAEQYEQARGVHIQNRSAAIGNVLSGTAAALGGAAQSYQLGQQFGGGSKTTASSGGNTSVYSSSGIYGNSNYAGSFVPPGNGYGNIG